MHLNQVGLRRIGKPYLLCHTYLVPEKGPFGTFLCLIVNWAVLNSKYSFYKKSKFSSTNLSSIMTWNLKWRTFEVLKVYHMINETGFKLVIHLFFSIQKLYLAVFRIFLCNNVKWIRNNLGLDAFRMYFMLVCHLNAWFYKWNINFLFGQQWSDCMKRKKLCWVSLVLNPNVWSPWYISDFISLSKYSITLERL